MSRRLWRTSASALSQIAGELVDLLAGRILVARNASFDIRLLHAELESGAALSLLDRCLLDQQTAVTWADGVLTTDEIADLVAVARMLDIPSETVAAAMQAHRRKGRAFADVLPPGPGRPDRAHGRHGPLPR